MSDDDGDDDGEYATEDINLADIDDPADEPTDEPAEIGNPENEQEHPDGSESEEDVEDYEPDEEPIEPVTRRTKIDPILRTSNKPRVVIVVSPDERVTDNRLHKSEASYVISMRAQQIAQSATCFTDGGSLYDPVALAYKELFDRRCPFTLRRTIGSTNNGDPIVEEWNIREMTLPTLTLPVALGSGVR